MPESTIRQGDRAVWRRALTCAAGCLLGWRFAVFARWFLYFGLDFGPQPAGSGGPVEWILGVAFGLVMGFLPRADGRAGTVERNVAALLPPTVWGTVLGGVLGFDGALIGGGNLGPPLALFPYGPAGAILGGAAGTLLSGLWRGFTGDSRGSVR